MVRFFILLYSSKFYLVRFFYFFWCAFLPFLKKIKKRTKKDLILKNYLVRLVRLVRFFILLRLSTFSNSLSGLSVPHLSKIQPVVGSNSSMGLNSSRAPNSSKYGMYFTILESIHYCATFIQFRSHTFFVTLYFFWNRLYG